MVNALPITPALIPGTYVAFASDLLWPAGKWPTVLTHNNMVHQNIGPIVDPKSREIVAFMYVNDASNSSITVFND